MTPVVPPVAAPRKYPRPRPNLDLPPLRATRVLDQLRERLRLMRYSRAAVGQRLLLADIARSRSLREAAVRAGRRPLLKAVTKPCRPLAAGQPFRAACPDAVAQESTSQAPLAPTVQAALELW